MGERSALACHITFAAPYHSLRSLIAIIRTVLREVTPKLPLEKLVHLGVVFPLEAQLDQKVDEPVVRVRTTLPLCGRTAIVRDVKMDLRRKPNMWPS